jgi:hypothetical protein
MAAPNWDYTALRPVVHNGVLAADTGDGLMADTVDNLGLVVGVDVSPARRDVLPRPADGAARTKWAAYAVGQGMDPVEVDDLARDEIRDRFPDPAIPKAEVKAEVKAEPKSAGKTAKP